MHYFITEKAMIKSAENHLLGVNVVIPRSSDVPPILRRLVLGTLFLANSLLIRRALWGIEPMRVISSRREVLRRLRLSI